MLLVAEVFWILNSGMKELHQIRDMIVLLIHGRHITSAEGMYYIRLILSNATTALVRCSYKETGSTDPDVIPVKPNDYYPVQSFPGGPEIASPAHYHYRTKVGEGLWVSTALVAPRSTTNAPQWPRLLIRQDTLPTVTNDQWLIANCTQTYCIHVNSIHLMGIANWEIDWYIGVIPPWGVLVNESNYRIWFSSQCPRDCTKGNRGECAGDGGKSSGTCLCRYGWIGFTCHESGGLSGPMVSMVVLVVLFGCSVMLAILMWCCCVRECECCDDGDGYLTL